MLIPLVITLVETDGSGKKIDNSSQKEDGAGFVTI